MPASILIVDDEKGIRESLGGLLRDEGYSVDVVGSGEECLEVVETRHYDLVLLDIWLPKLDGLETLERIQEQEAPPMVVVISGHANIETAVRATKLGAFDFIEKPLSLDKTVLVVKNALEYLRLEEENRVLRAQIEHRNQISGQQHSDDSAAAAAHPGRTPHSPGIDLRRERSRQKLIARALHAQSPRSSMRFVEVNCAAIPEELIESELFGHTKGSFTGASEDKTGKFRKADGGTLFLDEIGDMSLKTQSKVLRVLEQQRFEPLGSNETAKVDVRVIAATNKKLEEEISRNQFREDLFYRLNVIPFYAPATPRTCRRSRRALAAHFLAEFYLMPTEKNKKNSPPPRWTSLLSYPWPGNVRELKNLIERLVIICPASRIEPHHLPPEVFRGVSNSSNT